MSVYNIFIRVRTHLTKYLDLLGSRFSISKDLQIENFFPKNPWKQYCFTFVFILCTWDCQPRKSIVGYDLLIKFDGHFKYTIGLQRKSALFDLLPILIIFVQFYTNKNIFIFRDSLTLARAAAVSGNTLANVFIFTAHTYT